MAKELGISRTCAHRWHRRYLEHGWEGLQDRPSRPHSSPGATSPELVQDVLTQRENHREGPAELGLRTGVHPRTVSRILARAGVPKLWELDPVTGERIRSSRATGNRYEHKAPGDLLHVDVKKLGRIPDGGGFCNDRAAFNARCFGNTGVTTWTTASGWSARDSGAGATHQSAVPALEEREKIRDLLGTGTPLQKIGVATGPVCLDDQP